jgi:hypothetical protein
MRSVLLVLMLGQGGAALSQEAPPRPAPVSPNPTPTQDPRRWEAHYTDPSKPPPTTPQRRLDPLDAVTIAIYTSPAILLALLAIWIGRAIRNGW